MVIFVELDVESATSNIVELKLLNLESFVDASEVYAAYSLNHLRLGISHVEVDKVIVVVKGVEDRLLVLRYVVFYLTDEVRRFLVHSHFEDVG